MKKEHLRYLVCPICKGDLRISEGGQETAAIILAGILQCGKCGKGYNIINGIPRFVPIENYASSFGFEWTEHGHTQYDSYSGTRISEDRFFNETKWPRNLTGETILEIGSGSGRFTEQAASTGATIISMDYSYAVDANYTYNGKRDKVLIVQADLYHMPFKMNFFDKLFCFGVLQHTPDAKKAFLTLPYYLKPGGDLVIDIYCKAKNLRSLLQTKYLIRPITKNMSPHKLYRYCRRYIEFMWPMARIVGRTKIGRYLNRSLLIADYRNIYNLSEHMLREWAILDTFDMLSPSYDYPQTLKTVKQWFEEASMTNIEVKYGYNGIEGHGQRPC